MNFENEIKKILALESGADAFPAKPVDEPELTDQIGAMIRINEAEDSKQNKKQQLEELVAQRTEALDQELKQRKAAEEELKKSVSLLTATLESMADGILVVDMTGKIIIVNLLSFGASPNQSSQHVMMTNQSQLLKAFSLTIPVELSEN